MIPWLVSAGGYSAIWLVSARSLVARWSPVGLGNVTCTHYHRGGRLGAYDDNALRCPTSTATVTAAAMVAALGWPLILLIILVRCHPRKVLRRRRELRRSLRQQPGTAVVLQSPAWEKDMEDKLGIPAGD